MTDKALLAYRSVRHQLTDTFARFDALENRADGSVDGIIVTQDSNRFWFQYKNGKGISQRIDESKLEIEAHYDSFTDEWLFIEPIGYRTDSDAKECDSGLSCGNTCIAEDETCRLKANPTQGELIATIFLGTGNAVKEKGEEGSPKNGNYFQRVKGNREAQKQAGESLTTGSRVAIGAAGALVGAATWLGLDQVKNKGAARKTLGDLGSLYVGAAANNPKINELISKMPPSVRSKANKLQGRAKTMFAVADERLTGRAIGQEWAGKKISVNKKSNYSSFIGLQGSRLSVGSQGNNAMTMRTQRLPTTFKVQGKTREIYKMGLSSDLTSNGFGTVIPNSGTIDEATASAIKGMSRDMMNEHLSGIPDGSGIVMDMQLMQSIPGNDNLFKDYGFQPGPNGQGVLGIVSGGRVTPLPGTTQKRQETGQALLTAGRRANSDKDLSIFDLNDYNPTRQEVNIENYRRRNANRAQRTRRKRESAEVQRQARQVRKELNQARRAGRIRERQSNRERISKIRSYRGRAYPER